MSPARMIDVPSFTVSDESASRVLIVGGTPGDGAVAIWLTSGCIRMVI